ncbi:hypothetical protein QR680_001268 [Steinernema hermaphroditum]|uniref:non-specific serine/threonine protein kinase n=1 Tax=Steinernema hermaphroditum TaxID=289476 RepID=A0AA39GYF3_9BILA|nr:hypothetical protein QR680_001268 [Steinernema hermaphroditum]
MGNSLSTAIPTQILPVEAYIADVPELKFVMNLGSTRFMKVARADHFENGPMVLKVFVLCDQSFSIEPYREQILQLRIRLQSCANCCPFNRVYVANSQQCAILSRPYYKDTLYDRMSTRPFLIDSEKRWIAFQLLKALKQCFEAEVCHGDLKSQNVLISSSNWVQITDFASFKPAFLAMDNPSNFTFYFDTSRRRHCYLAPERFQTTSEVQKLPGEYSEFTEGLTHEMDVYSMACVIIELYTDGKCPFYFGDQLISYVLGDDASPVVTDYITTALQGVPEQLHPLLRVMLAKDPEGRRCWLEEFDKLNGPYFPSIFDKFVYGYFKSFRAKPPSLSNLATLADAEQPSSGKILRMEADETVSKVSSDFFTIWEQLNEVKDSHPDIVVLFVSLLTSEMRALRSFSAKLEAVRLLKKFAEISSAYIVTERIIPSLICSLFDPFVHVRCEAIYLLADMVESLKEAPKEGYRLFADYLFPKLKNAANDKSAYVRMALAHNLGRFAQCSLRFIRDLTSALTDVENVGDGTDCDIDTPAKAKHTLQQAIIEIFVALCTNGDNNVRLCLVSEPTTLQLCDFFAITDIETQLSHMISFINDKEDWRLRDAFFNSIWIPTCFVSRQRYEMKPLLEEGLNDAEEFVILRTIKCIHILCERGILDKWGLIPLLEPVLRFLAHPNKWLRLAVVSLLVAMDKNLTVADIRCKVVPKVKHHLKENLITFVRPRVIYECLKQPIPRVVWEITSDLNLLLDPVFKHLHSAQMLANLDGVRDALCHSNSARLNPSFQSKESQNVDAAVQKLRNLGLSDRDMDRKLLAFEDLFKRSMSLKRGTSTKRGASGRGQPGVVNLKRHTRTHRRKFDLEKGCAVVNQTESLHSTTVAANADWREMFGNDDDNRSSSSQRMERGSSAVERKSLAPSLPTNATARTPEHSNARWATSKTMLNSLLSHKRDIYVKCKRSAATFPSNRLDNDSDAFYNDAALTTNIGKTDVRQVAHIHEHMSSVTQLTSSADGLFFASASKDQSVRIWSAKQIQGDCSVAIRSEQTLNHGSRVNAVQFLYSRHNHIVTGGDDSRLTIFDLGQQQLVRTVPLDQKADGAISHMYGADALLYVLTHHGSLFCFDFRMPHAQAVAPRLMGSTMPRWRDRIPNKYGLISSFAVDPFKNHWMALTCTTRQILLWDIRFGLEVASWAHVIRPRHGMPDKKPCRLTKCWANSRPGCDSQLYTSSEFNGEVSLWNMSTQERTDVLWCHKNKPLQYSSDTNHQTTALAVCPVTHGIYTGDSFGALRFWDLSNTASCAYLSGPAKKSPHGEFLSDHRRAVYCNTYEEGVKVTYEDLLVSKNPDGKYDQTAVSPHVGEYHRDAITDVVCLAGDLFASSDRNGVIKVWKRFNENRF